MPENFFHLNCLVQGDALDCLFPVQLPSFVSVVDLREAIKDELQHMFHNIDPNQLGLYCVSLSNDSELEDQLEGLNFDKSLEPTLTLADVFAPFPVEGYLHIIF
ncbi:hypothetical protein EDD16DRAFT_1475875 [Pisolithus croceorrhizus]|nr:hypothetical protein EDD16DRAFT_1475875 [Pisolithus croceorrhizus]KAI6133987.1 hypothetical protein EV401DRAFT_1847988 [Pisolithus croceorrhizus]KAI6137607.1 hypothetical protein EDD17DRAFT_1501512 [Pisolithus thermaeus]